MNQPIKLKSREELEQIAEKIEYAVFYQNMTASIDILQQLQEETVRVCAAEAERARVTGNVFQAPQAILSLLTQPQPEKKD